MTVLECVCVYECVLMLLFSFSFSPLFNFCVLFFFFFFLFVVRKSDDNKSDELMVMAEGQAKASGNSGLKSINLRFY